MIALFFSFVILASVVNAATIADLEGTWSTKSRKVTTGSVGTFLAPSEIAMGSSDLELIYFFSTELLRLLGG